MNLFFENQGTNTFLVYEIAENDELDTMSLGMLTNNKIAGLAPTVFTQLDTTKYIKYNVSAKISVSQLFSGPVNKKRLLGVFTGIIDAMLAAEDYMLDTDSMLLDLDYIFADVSTCDTVLICLPVMNSGRKNPELSMFFKNIIFNTQFDQTENCDHVAQILNYLNSVQTLSLHDFKELLKGMSKAKEAVKPAPAPAPVQEPAKPVAQPVVQPQKPVVQPQVPVQPVKPQVPVQPVGFEVPGKTPVPVHLPTEQPPVTKAEPEEKPMSMFYLLQHYNKDNAAKYKAQQAAKKDQEKNDKKDKKDKKENKDKKAPKEAVPVPVGGFAIPGQQQAPVSPAFDIPGKSAPAPQPAAQQPVIKPQQPVIQQPKPVSVVQPVPVSAGKPLNFGETTVLGGGAMGETTVLGAAPVDAPKVNPYLVRAKNNEKIPLNKPVFRIGKERSYVDYFIGDNTAISRSHANIVNHNGEFYVVDTNSTNHTYVNGTMIQSNVETRLENNDRLRLANEEFEFRLF